MPVGLEDRPEAFDLRKGAGGRRKVGNINGEECSFVSGMVPFNLRMLRQSFYEELKQAVKRAEAGSAHKASVSATIDCRPSNDISVFLFKCKSPETGQMRAFLCGR